MEILAEENSRRIRERSRQTREMIGETPESRELHRVRHVRLSVRTCEMAHDELNIDACGPRAGLDPAGDLPLRHAETVHSAVDLNDSGKCLAKALRVHRPRVALVE